MRARPIRRRVRLCWADLPSVASGASPGIRGALLLAAILLICLAGAVSAGTALAVTPEAAAIEPVELLTDAELQELVAPVALYPDDLLAIVLPASTFPLQVVLAARFLEAREADPELQPDDAWDASIVALLNYPEIVALLDGELTWTWQLGEAVLVQQEDVITAVADFRKQASAAGNLESDDKQVVSVSAAGAIEITPVEREAIYVPYYDPAEVVTYQPRRVYYYYPRAYPVYYYPYPSGHYFSNGAFWGVTSAFSIGWRSGSLHWHHHGFHDHPYFGYSYYDPFYYRRPDVWLSHHRQDRLRRHHRRHHDDNRWRDDDRHRGSEAGRRPDRHMAGNRPHGVGNRYPAGQGRAARPDSIPAGRGMERNVVSTLGKRSGYIPASRGHQRRSSPATSAAPDAAPAHRTRRLATASRSRSSNAPSPRQGDRPGRQLPAFAANNVNRAAADRAWSIQQRAAEPTQETATRSAAVTPPQRPGGARQAVVAPSRLLRQRFAKPDAISPPPRVAVPIRKPSSVQRPAFSPRPAAPGRSLRTTRPAAAGKSVTSAPPRVQQRSNPGAASLGPRATMAPRGTPPAMPRNAITSAIARNAAKPARSSVHSSGPRYAARASIRPPATGVAGGVQQKQARQSVRRRPERLR